MREASLADCTYFVGVLEAATENHTAIIPYVAVGPLATNNPDKLAKAGMHGLEEAIRLGLQRSRQSPFDALTNRPRGWRATLGPTRGMILMPDESVFVASINTTLHGWEQAIRDLSNQLVLYFAATTQLWDAADGEAVYSALEQCAVTGKLASGLVTCTWQLTDPRP